MMAEEGFKRKLTAILSADVVGYSRLMDDNEEATIRTLNADRASMTTLIQHHKGRVVDANVQISEKFVRCSRRRSNSIPTSHLRT
jgi:class 3 adenylate cyclase